ncbi:MAG: nucleotide exchange factor GrpE [Prolixibacteraceae bacterium]|nr:nucleotide exchange factor GrpE [Prolixibacteraceae bacterium]
MREKKHKRTENQEEQSPIHEFNTEETLVTDCDSEELAEENAGKIDELEVKIEEMTDKHLRLQAEFDNFRKRTLKEKAELIKSGGESVLINILPIIDDFERAIDSMKEVAADDPAKIGIILIFSKFKDFLKQNHVMEIDALGEDFDVDLHEAITKISVDEKEKAGKVVDVVQKGYTLNDKVIRYAKVIIGE